MAAAININNKEVAKRRLIGIVMALAALAVAVGLILSDDISRWWRCVVFLPAWAAALGFLQAYHST